MSLQLARYLKDFSEPRRPQSPFLHDGAFAGSASLSEEPAFDLSAPEPRIDVEAEREQAFAAGRAEAEAELGARHLAEVEDLRKAHAAEIEALRDHLERHAAAMIAERFTTMTAWLADRVASQAANVLAPVLDEVLARQAVENLAAMIRAGLPEGDGIVVTVKGPSNLFEQLKLQFEEGAPMVLKHLEADDLDLAAEFGDTVLVTRMAAWADTVRRVLA
ncbi:hypothetical protein [Rhizobium sp. GN54]|uniref:hypothetical protein n=1 Tax=Rhizobium sp. GN54 TaxID=2898150 RepID=UPI001E637EF3|nr:hypothetical protein [Rhizobium sp. GN54]MCD2183423.1 hypothetical protein [Rhizobium sp. GN54]